MPEDIAYAVVGTLTKSTTEDGVLTFEASKATGPDLDGDGQRADMSWAIPAMREWFATGGNLREQHDPKRAIGKAMTLEEREDGAYISGRVVDPVAIAKVNEGVLPYLSIGVKGHKLDYTQKALAPNGMIVGGRIVEVSLVDRPSNPTTRLVLGKAAEPDGALEVPESADLIEDTDADKAERVEHSHSHEHSDGHHRHQHNHGPGVAEHRALGSGVPHNHQHAADDPSVVADREQGLSDADKEGNNKAEDIDTFVDVNGDLVEIPALSKAVLTAADRKALPKSDYVFPDKAPGPGSYPIPDETHARAALRFAAGKSEEGSVKAAVRRKFPDIQIDGDSEKSEEPGEEKAMKPGKPNAANPDPDKDGDDDTHADSDTDHDYWNADGSLTPRGKAAGMKTKGEEPDEIKSETPDLIKALTEPDAVKALREAIGFDPAQSVRREEFDELKADMEKVMGMSIPGAVRARPQGARMLTDARAAAEAKRDRYRQLADTIEDPGLRQGYAEMAKAITADLEKLTA
jgi:hypothetical protein